MDINATFIKLSDARLEHLHYGDGSLAVVASGSNEPTPVTLSVNLGMYGMTPPKGCIYVPEYGKHEGLPGALIDAEVADPIERVQFGPFDASAWLMRLTNPSTTDAQEN